MTKITNHISTSWAELRLIRVGQHLWAWHKKACGKSPQVGEKQALYMALEDVWHRRIATRARREYQGVHASRLLPTRQFAAWKRFEEFRANAQFAFQ